jgi:hypothetical protein
MFNNSSHRLREVQMTPLSIRVVLTGHNDSAYRLPSLLYLRHDSLLQFQLARM